MSAADQLDDRQRTFVAGARSATLATIAPDGRPRLVPICFVLLLTRAGDSSGAAPSIVSPLDEKPKTAGDPHRLARVHDLVARPEATLLIDRWSEEWDRLGWVRLEVRGVLVEPGGEGHAAAVEALREKYPQYGAHDLEHRPMLRFVIDRVVSWGDLG